MELGPEDVSLLERCPHFRGWYVQTSMELGPEDVSLLERCPHFRGWYVQESGPERCVPIIEVPSFQRVPLYQHSVPYTLLTVYVYMFTYMTVNIKTLLSHIVM